MMTPDAFSLYLKRLESKPVTETAMKPAPVSDSEGEEHEAGDAKGGAGIDRPVNGESKRATANDVKASPVGVQEPSVEKSTEATVPISDDEGEEQESAQIAQQPPKTEAGEKEEIDEIYVGKKISEYMVYNKV